MTGLRSFDFVTLADVLSNDHCLLYV